MRGADLQNPKEGEVETGEFSGEEVCGDGRAVERALAPFGREACGVVRMEMSEEIGLAFLAPPIHRDHSFLHLFLALEMGFGGKLCG